VTKSGLAVGLMAAFAAGIAVRDAAQDWRDEQRKQQLIAAIRACPQYVVLDRDGKPECRAMMPRLDFTFPLPKRQKRKQLTSYEENTR